MEMNSYLFVEERPNVINRDIPTKRTIEGYYAKEYNTDNNTVFIM